MTPQERDLITALLGRLKQQANQPKDPEADALIRQGVAQQPDAPYLLVQTVLIQDMALRNAENRIAELERQLAGQAAPPEPRSFLGSVPPAGPWTRTMTPPPAPTAAPSWTQSAGAPAQGAPALMPGAGSGFLRQAAATAAGIAGGALLFQGIESLFGPHYGSSFLGGVAAQPSLSETVVNNYYGDQGAPDVTQADAGADQDPGLDNAADQDMGDADVADQDFANQDFGTDDSNFDV